MSTQDIFKLVEKNTSEVGNFRISFNEHIESTTYNTITKESYPTKPQDYYGLDEDDLKENNDVDWNANIYNFQWYNRTQVGFYMLFSNTFEGLIEKIKKLLGEELK